MFYKLRDPLCLRDSGALISAHILTSLLHAPVIPSCSVSPCLPSCPDRIVSISIFCVFSEPTQFHSFVSYYMHVFVVCQAVKMLFYVVFVFLSPSVCAYCRFHTKRPAYLGALSSSVVQKVYKSHKVWQISPATPAAFNPCFYLFNSAMAAPPVRTAISCVRHPKSTQSDTAPVSAVHPVLRPVIKHVLVERHTALLSDLADIIIRDHLS